MRQKRIVLFTLASTLLLPIAVFASPMLRDIEGNAFKEDIEGLLQRGIVQGYADLTFRPDQLINRAEFMKILIGSRFPERMAKDLRCFTDFEVQVPQWYANSVCVGQELGIVSGYPDGSFQPNRAVIFAEALKMAFRSFGIVPPVIPNVPWYVTYLEEARSRGILTWLLQHPEHLLTRGEMAEITYILTLGAEHTAEHPSNESAICGDGKKESPEQCDDGNVLDGDGCSSICISVPEPVRRAILQIDAEATGIVSTIAQGQRRLPLLKFTVTAGRQDALLTSLVFSPTVGSLLYGQHYTLSTDPKGTGAYDTVIEADGKTDGSRLIFDRFSGNGVLIPAGISVPFVLTADLVSTLGPVTLGVNFATDTEGYVQAQGASDGLVLTGIETNSSCPSDNCFIRVNTRATSDINVVQRGSLFVTEDSTPAISHILLGGTITPPLLRLRMHATGEDVDLHELRIDGVSNAIDSLLLYAGSSTTPFAQASNGQCANQASSRMCTVLGLRTLVIPANKDVTVVVAAKMKTDALGGTSGENLTLSLGAATDDLGLAVKARGISSNQELAQNNGDAGSDGEIFVGRATPAMNTHILGRTHDTALATIANVSNAAAKTSSSIPIGYSIIGSFKIDSAPHSNSKNGSNDVVLKTLTFHVSAQNVQIDPASVRLTSKDDPNAELACSASGSTGDITVTCANIDSGTIQNRINQGQYVIYNLAANVTNTAITLGTSSLYVELPTLGTRSQTNSILWSDEATVFTWVDVPVRTVTSTVFQR